MTDVVLGLIGDNIGESRAPQLHELAGGLSGVNVRYNLLVPAELGQDFDAVFEAAARERQGLNITLPYKERVVPKLQIDDPLVRAIGAVNTVIFKDGVAFGFNTDYSGFKAAFQNAMGVAAPGPVCLIGAGGVGKAIAFGLAALGARDIRLLEVDQPKAEALATALRKAQPALTVTVSSDVGDCVSGVEGILNCTPLGMAGYGGTPLGAEWMRGAEWVFDAVYTPRDTTFLSAAAANGHKTISGYELFFYQGVDAFRHFTGRAVDEAALRKALADAE